MPNASNRCPGEHRRDNTAQRHGTPSAATGGRVREVVKCHLIISFSTGAVVSLLKRDETGFMRPWDV
jgi:hypothetical protein